MYMRKVDQVRASTVYSHDVCSEECRRRGKSILVVYCRHGYKENVCTGCGKLYSIDGNWKICYPHCMWKIPMEPQGFNGGLNYVNCCPNEPEPGKALCKHHCIEVEERGIPCGLKDYSQYISHEGIISSNNNEC